MPLKLNPLSVAIGVILYQVLDLWESPCRSFLERKWPTDPFKKAPDAKGRSAAEQMLSF